MEYRARYALIGAFSLVCLLAAFSFVYWIKNTGGLGQRSIYELRFEQSVSGLNPGASVLFNGVRVGAVTAIALDAAHPKRVTATISAGWMPALVSRVVIPVMDIQVSSAA